MLIEPSPRVDELAERTIGAAIEVHKQLGPGFLEAFYEEALSIELDERGIPHERQVPTRLTYKGRVLGDARVDMVVGGDLVVELKTVDSLQPVHRAQALAYLKALDLPLGLLMNFNTALLKKGLRRVIWSKHARRIGI